MAYRIELKPSAARCLSKLPHPTQRAIVDALDGLKTKPRPNGVVKLNGEPVLYRVRVGDYRVAYTIKDRVLFVLVVRIPHRKEIYR